MLIKLIDKFVGETMTRKFTVAVGVLVLIGVFYAAFAEPKLNGLNKLDGWKDTGLIQHWKKGDVAVIVRHEERCDRSSNPCLEQPDGITVLGSQRAQRTGKHMERHLGLQGADLFTSPKTRTVQTAAFMLRDARPLASRESICGDDVISELHSHKQPQRNLVLVTHSGCINEFIKRAGYKKEDSLEYGSLVFIRFLSPGDVEIIGKLEVE